MTKEYTNKYTEKKSLKFMLDLSLDWAQIKWITKLKHEDCLQISSNGCKTKRETLLRLSFKY